MVLSPHRRIYSNMSLYAIHTNLTILIETVNMYIQRSAHVSFSICAFTNYTCHIFVVWIEKEREREVWCLQNRFVCVCAPIFRSLSLLCTIWFRFDAAIVVAHDLFTILNHNIVINLYDSIVICACQPASLPACLNVCASTFIEYTV